MVSLVPSPKPSFLSLAVRYSCRTASDEKLGMGQGTRLQYGSNFSFFLVLLTCHNFYM